MQKKVMAPLLLMTLSIFLTLLCHANPPLCLENITFTTVWTQNRIDPKAQRTLRSYSLDDFKITKKGENLNIVGSIFYKFILPTHGDFAIIRFFGTFPDEPNDVLSIIIDFPLVSEDLIRSEFHSFHSNVSTCSTFFPSDRTKHNNTERISTEIRFHDLSAAHCQTELRRLLEQVFYLKLGVSRTTIAHFLSQFNRKFQTNYGTFGNTSRRQ